MLAYRAIMLVGFAVVVLIGIAYFVGWIRWRWAIWKCLRMSDAQRRGSIDGSTPPGFDVLRR